MASLFGDLLPLDVQYSWDRAIMFEKKLLETGTGSNLTRKYASQTKKSNVTSVDKNSDDIAGCNNCAIVETQNAKIVGINSNSENDPKQTKHLENVPAIAEAHETKDQNRVTPLSSPKRPASKTDIRSEKRSLPTGSKVLKQNTAKLKISSPLQNHFCATEPIASKAFTPQQGPYSVTIDSNTNQTRK